MLNADTLSMQPKILSKRALLAVVLSGLTIFSALLLYFIPKTSIQRSSVLHGDNATALPNQERASVGLPVLLKIPTINVHAPVTYVGLAEDGAMAVPKGPADVAWYQHGKRPGENGSAVIAGHYGWKNNLPAVFDNLHTLSKGDRIYIEDEKGVTIVFVVREIKIYGKDDDASSVFSSSDGRAHLNLVTCTGVWNKAAKTFSERLVVFADKE